jgi:serine/threonine protein kinase/uncharacterized protein YjdB
MTDRLCSRCGTPIVAGANFCSRCGFDVSGEQAVLATAKMAPVAPRPSKPPSEILEPLRHATIGDYDIAGELGRGGMATVFKAHDIALDREVAIKVMTPSLVSGAGMVERFKREARMAAKLSHPHIIPIYAVRETGNLLFFVMKYVQGRSLDTVIRERGALPIPVVQAILNQVGGALGYAHDRHVYHRDIKPANIMLDDEGWAVVTDFGIAKQADARGLTMTGVTIGTPSYMSPEQCASKEITGATDQYSLGIVAYELLTGRVPFDADSLMGIMWKHFNEPPPPVRDARPDCPEHIADAIARMLAKDPAARWPTMEDALTAIGHPPTAPGDPIRKQIRALARGGTGEALRDAVHTPASPIPTAGFSPDAPTMPSGPAPVPSGFQAARTPPPAPPTGSRTGGDTPTVVTGDAPGILAHDGATVVTAGGAVTTRVTGGAATLPPSATRPTAPRVPPAEPAPRPRRGVKVGLGLAGLTLATAVAVSVVLLAVRPSGTGDGEAPPGMETPEGPAAPPHAPVAGVELTPGGMTITEGESGDLKAFLFDSTNVPLGDRAITWRSTNEAVATVRAGLGVAGVVQAVRAGTARIIAMSEGKADTATVTVTAGRATVARVVVQVQVDTLAPGESVPIVALAQDASNNNLGGRRTDWRVEPPGIVRVDSVQLTAVKDGVARIVAVSEGVSSDPRRIVVNTPAITSVRIVGAPESLVQGASATLRVEVRDARGRVVSGPDVRWSSSDEGRAGVSQTGVVGAREPGTVRITAQVGSVSDAAPLRIVPTPRVAVARLTISRQVGTLEVGRTHNISASPLDAAGRTLDRRVTFESSNPDVASIRQDGTIEARRPGRVTITARVEDQTQRFDLEVTPTPAAPPVEQPPPAPPPTAPPMPAPTGLAASSLGLGAEFSCATRADGPAACWGAAPAFPPTPGFQQIASGAGHACGLAANGTVSCWGANASGQVGNEQPSHEPVPRPMAVATPQRFRSIVAGAFHTCGIATDGSAWCWGENNDAQLGNNSNRDAAAPVAVERGLTYQALAAGEKHTCGVAADGRVYCWGDGFAYQLGIGVTEQRRTPDAARMREPATVIAAGRNSTCAVGAEGSTYCWGSAFGSEPRRVETDQRFTQLAVGDDFACGLTRAGAAWCWGRGRRGQLGDGAGRDSRGPVRVATGEPLASIAAGNAHACALTRTGSTLCWGQNARGQVGTAGTDPVLGPVPVEIRR